MAAFNEALHRKISLLILIKRRRDRRKRKMKHEWVRKIFQERKTKGEFQLLVKDLHLFDSEYFFRNFRMANSIQFNSQHN